MDENVFRANISQKINDKFSIRVNTQFSNYKTDADAGPFKDDVDYTIKNKNALVGFGADYKLAKASCISTTTIIASTVFIWTTQL